MKLEGEAERSRTRGKLLEFLLTHCRRFSFHERDFHPTPLTPFTKVVIAIVCQTKYFSVSVVSCFSAAALHTTGGLFLVVYGALQVSLV